MNGEPICSAINKVDPAYKEAIKRAKASLPEFRVHCQRVNELGSVTLVKKEVRHGDHCALLWFSEAQPEGVDFKTEVFEVPPDVTSVLSAAVFPIATTIF